MAAYQGRGLLKSRPSGTRVVTNSNLIFYCFTVYYYRVRSRLAMLSDPSVSALQCHTIGFLTEGKEAILLIMVLGQNGRGQNGTDKMVRTKWHR